MQMPLQDLDNLCAELLQDIPLETSAMAREFEAFIQAKKA
jgi:hypothetical protein